MSKLPDVTKLTEEEKIQLDIYHDSDMDLARKNLAGLYGRIAPLQDARIIAAVTGRRVLDVGSGWGGLSARLKSAGLDVVSIEPHLGSREAAKRWHGVEALPYEIYKTPFEDKCFDTVILREVVDHLDFTVAMPEISRICKHSVIIFHPHLTLPLRIARRFFSHPEFNEQHLSHYRKILSTAGFGRQSVTYSDWLAFPLSGGYITRQWAPRCESLESALARFDNWLNGRMQWAGNLLAWRFLLKADRI